MYELRMEDQASFFNFLRKVVRDLYMIVARAIGA